MATVVSLVSSLCNSACGGGDDSSGSGAEERFGCVGAEKQTFGELTVEQAQCVCQGWIEADREVIVACEGEERYGESLEWCNTDVKGYDESCTVNIDEYLACAKLHSDATSCVGLDRPSKPISLAESSRCGQLFFQLSMDCRVQN